MFAQGDLLFIPVENIPFGLAQLSRKNGKIVLVEGEATGHAHTINGDKTEAWKDGKETVWLNIEEALAEVKHEEHATIQLPKGNYQVIKQREYVTPQIKPRQITD